MTQNEQRGMGRASASANAGSREWRGRFVIERPTLRQKQGPSATRIIGVGSFQPDRVVTNDDLSEIMETDDKWIRDRVGIIERRFAEKDELLVDMAVKAGTNALTDAGTDPSEVDTVIV